MAASRGLGKGLDALIPSASAVKSQPTKVSKKTESTPVVEKVKEEKKEEVVETKEPGENDVTFVKITTVEPNRDQPRKNFDEDALLELSESIKQYGLLQPILVQKRNDYLEIIAGERRWRASKLAGLKEVPVIIKDYSEQEIVEIALIENIQRENLNPIEEAQAYKRLLNEFNLKQDEIAERVSKSRTAVTNSMRLLKLCDNVQQMVIDDMLTTGHARALITVEDPEVQYTLAQKIFDEKLSVRDVEKLIRNLNNPKKQPRPENVTLNLIYKEIENKLKNNLGTKVSVNAKDNGSGKLEIEFFNHDDLERIIDLLSR